jgi:D-aminopeptidase
VRINGVPVGEAAISALAAAHYGVPIALVTGDKATADMAEMACWIQGVERRDARSVVLSGAAPLALYQRFVTIVTLTCALVE